ncbi:hypothetical protein Hdeb2414_s0601g00922611 [Helianthus debilis subsp. tardiflorus]
MFIAYIDNDFNMKKIITYHIVSLTCHFFFVFVILSMSLTSKQTKTWQLTFFI